MDISVVVPLYNEEESLPELFPAWIERVMKAMTFLMKLFSLTTEVPTVPGK